ncbi:hypothetical protein A2Y99_00040 [Candidatus Gottesmanbacteria bacterium RBG_13_37_7]|uniref:ATP-grasp domain-containing protein n=1 Tax=Candidatus Gottesmanbacteria bacterium RBG_13_37_7 TaxID=1798369 RepID=A0A1F5YGJ1_9BACT|nr:MAG: hypothetical protein A2Y99_00040 [Candidatus Gottesmanbacteria bacterium RBG_13_37_7]
MKKFLLLFFLQIMTQNQTEESEDPGGNTHSLFQNQFEFLIISNLAETYQNTYKKAGGQTVAGSVERDLLEAERAVLYEENNKVVVTSVPINLDYLNDLKESFGYSNLLNLYPASPNARLSLDILKDKNLFTQIEIIIKNNPGINIVPYYATEEFFDLLAFLRQKNLKFSTPETVSSRNRFIRDHYNCKVGFRKLWEKSADVHSFVKIPQGFIVDDLTEALDAAWWFYLHKTDFVMKYNRGTSGLGIIFYRCKDLPGKENDFKRYLRKNHRERIWFEENFVVEEFIDVDEDFFGGSPSIEFKVNSDLKHTYNCFQRLDVNAAFKGILISKQLEDESDVDFERAVDNCMDFGSSLEELGYKGIFDIDLVVDKKHNIYAVESNLRRTGGTHVYEAAMKLFGKNFRQKTFVASNDFLKLSSTIRTYQDFKSRTEKFFFSKATQEGIIPVITSYIEIGMIGYIIFAPTLDRLERIEKELYTAVS